MGHKGYHANYKVYGRLGLASLVSFILSVVRYRPFRPIFTCIFRSIDCFTITILDTILHHNGNDNYHGIGILPKYHNTVHFHILYDINCLVQGNLICGWGFKRSQGPQKGKTEWVGVLSSSVLRLFRQYSIM